jgi:hypothetical protein
LVVVGGEGRERGRGGSHDTVSCHAPNSDVYAVERTACGCSKAIVGRDFELEGTHEIIILITTKFKDHSFVLQKKCMSGRGTIILYWLDCHFAMNELH